MIKNKNTGSKQAWFGFDLRHWQVARGHFNKEDDDLIEAVHAALEKDRIARQARDELDDIRARLATLTPREREVMTHVVSGQLNKEIAYDLGTVEKPSRSIAPA